MIRKKNDGVLKIFLAGKQALSSAEWKKLVELRLEAIMPFLSHVSLNQLGSKKCMANQQPEDTNHSISSDNPVVFTDAELSLKTPGIFASKPFDISEESPPVSGRGIGRKGSKKFWGVTRKGKWVIVTIDYIYIFGQFWGQDPAYPKYQQAEKIIIKAVSLDEILQDVLPATIWENLSVAVREIAEERMLLSQGLTALSQVFESENALYGAMTDSQSSQ